MDKSTIFVKSYTSIYLGGAVDVALVPNSVEFGSVHTATIK
jgi:hypothetical protein